jgi:uroporphyrinogen-III synthase
LPKALITRPRAEAEKLAALIAARGYEPLFNPLLEILPLEAPMPEGEFSGIVFTSATALRHIPPQLDRALPVYGVGESTAAAARQAGFTTIVGVAPTVPALLPVLKELPPGTRLLYPGGRNTAHDLAALLRPQDIHVKSWPLYESRFLPLAPETIHLLSGGEVRWILLFSERTAAALNHALPLNHRDWSGKVGIAAISEAALAPVKDLGWARLTIAREPTAAGVLDCLTDG